MLFSYFTNAPTTDPFFSSYRHLERLKTVLRISKVFGWRGWATYTLTIINVQKCWFLATSENLSQEYMLVHENEIINNDCLLYIHSLDFSCKIYERWTIPYFVSFISNMANSTVFGPIYFDLSIRRLHDLGARLLKCHF